MNPRTLADWTPREVRGQFERLSSSHRRSLIQAQMNQEQAAAFLKANPCDEARLARAMRKRMRKHKLGAQT